MLDNEDAGVSQPSQVKQAASLDIAQPRVKREPRFPFQFSTTRTQSLISLPHQREARQAFIEVARVQRSQPSGYFYSSGSDSGPDSDADQPPLAPQLVTSGTLSKARSEAPGGSNPTCAPITVDGVTHTMSSSTGPTSSARRASVSESTITTSTTNTELNVERYLARLEARFAKAHPNASHAELQLLVVRAAKQAYLRARARHIEAQKSSQSTVNESKPSVEQNDADETKRPEHVSTEQRPEIKNDTDKSDTAVERLDPSSQEQGVRQETSGDPSPLHDAPPAATGPVADSWGPPPEPFLPSDSADITVTNHENYVSSDSDAEDGTQPMSKRPVSTIQQWQRFSGMQPRDRDAQSDSIQDEEDLGQSTFDPPSPRSISSPREQSPARPGYESSSDDDSTAMEITRVPKRAFPASYNDSTQFVKRYVCDFEGCGYSALKTRDILSHKLEKHYICIKCDLEFSDAQALREHQDTSAKHIMCKTCRIDFATAAGRNRHLAASHPKDADLQCPGCGDAFATQSSFIMHLEEGQCTGITPQQYQKARTMVWKIQDFDVVEFAETKSDHDANINSPLHDSHTRLPPSYVPPQGRADAPALGTTNALRAKLQGQPANGPMPTIQLNPREHRLFELYKRMLSPPGQYILPIDSSGTPIWQAVPDHRLYAPQHFYNSFVQSHLCPQTRCGKRFKRAEGLDRHLRSSAHRDDAYVCPECSRQFGSASGLIAHFEASGSKCFIRHSEIYKEAVEVASGDFLSVVYLEDGGTKVVAKEPTW